MAETTLAVDPADQAKAWLAAHCPPAGSRWRHRKGGEYAVVCGALIEANLGPAVVYRSEADGTTWVRPLGEFFDGRFAPLPG